MLHHQTTLASRILLSFAAPTNQTRFVKEVLAADLHENGACPKFMLAARAVVLVAESTSFR